MLNDRWLALLRDLATTDQSDAPFISLYLDIRPDGAARRECLNWLRDTLHKHEKATTYHGHALTSYEDDIAWVQDYLGDHRGGSYDPASHGLAFFLCHAEKTRRVLELPVPVVNTFHVGGAPVLMPLVTAVSPYPDYAVALADADTCRVFSISLARVVEREEHQGDTADLSWTSRAGGSSLARYQRHIDHWRSAFARESAHLIAELVERTKAPYLVLGGEPGSTAEVQRHLPKSIRALIIGQEHMDVDQATETDVVRITEPMVEMEANHQIAAEVDGTLEAVAEGRPACAGIGPTLLALEEQTVAQIILPARFDEPGWQCASCRHIGEGAAPRSCPLCANATTQIDLLEAMLRSALAQDAAIVYASEAGALADYGGVGALLRNRTIAQT